MVTRRIQPVPIDGVLCDLLMGVMNSMAAWSAAAGDRRRGLAWRDAVTDRMIASSSYVPYEELIAAAASATGQPGSATETLLARWETMEPWPDAAALDRLPIPYAFVTNASARLAELAARRSGLSPVLTLSAEEAGCYKPDRRIYAEACRRMGSRPDRMVFVAGSPYDAAGASAAGLRTWFVARRPDQRVDDRALRVSRSLEEVVAAIGELGRSSS